MARVRVRVLRVRVRVRVLCIRVRVRVLTKGLESESESLKIWTRVRLEYTVGLEYYITALSPSFLFLSRGPHPLQPSRGSGERCELPRGCRQGPAIKRFQCILWLKTRPLVSGNSGVEEVHKRQTSITSHMVDQNFHRSHGMMLSAIPNLNFWRVRTPTVGAPLINASSFIVVVVVDRSVSSLSMFMVLCEPCIEDTYDDVDLEEDPERNVDEDEFEDELYDDYYDDEVDGRPKRADDELYESDMDREAVRELLAERAAEEARQALLAYLTAGEPTYKVDEPLYLPIGDDLDDEEEDYNELTNSEDEVEPDVYDQEPEVAEKRFYPYSYEPYGGRWGALVPGAKRGDRDPYDRLYRLAEVLSRPAQLGGDVDDYEKKK